MEVKLTLLVVFTALNKRLNPSLCLPYRTKQIWKGEVVWLTYAT